MTCNAFVQCALYCVLLVALGVPLGAYMARVYKGAKLGKRLLGPLERLFYRVAGVNGRRGHGLEAVRGRRARCSTCSATLAVYAIQRLQGVLPLNPAAPAAVIPRSPSTPR